MNKLIILMIIAAVISACSPADSVSIHSPDKAISTVIETDANGVIRYHVEVDGQPVILSSSLGFDLKENEDFLDHFILKEARKLSFDQRWEMPWGEQRYVRNQYNEAALTFQEADGLKRTLRVVFRVFDDGVAFRCEFPKQPNLKGAITIFDENSEFNLSSDPMVWWIPGDWDIYEKLYNTTRLSQIDALQYQFFGEFAQTWIPENAVNTPVTMKTDDGIYLAFHEANLTDYAGMTLKIVPDSLKMVSELVGRPDGAKVTRNIPFHTPWRTIQIGRCAGDLMESRMIENLNEPNVLGDVSWFKPTKYLGIWWELHLDKTTWNMTSGRHGATTEHAMELIDFAAENNIHGLLIEGWNTGWEHWYGFKEREGIFDFITPYPDYDLEKVLKYGKSKGIELIMHHETAAAPRTYEAQMDTAFHLMQNLGIHAVKTGYVGRILPEGEFHHGQWMVNHYRKVIETAAKYQIAVNAHEPIKATGLRRTYPNTISREGLRGQEYNAWSVDGGNPPEHLTIVPFTRMLAGPIDFTPGIFNLSLKPYKPNNQVNTTIAKQLALYVVIYSPVQMAADLIENYRGHPAFQFIRDVAVDWEESHVLNGEIGDYVTIVRKERNGDRWFLGSVTDENSRTMTVLCDFLDEGKKYRAIRYLDSPDAHWKTKPTAYTIDTLNVNRNDSIELVLAPGGGAAMSFSPH